jgi:hypothetical protein
MDPGFRRDDDSRKAQITVSGLCASVLLTLEFVASCMDFSLSGQFG